MIRRKQHITVASVSHATQENTQVRTQTGATIVHLADTISKKQNSGVGFAPSRSI